MIMTCSKQPQSFLNTLASIVGQNANTLKHLLMTHSFGMKLFNSIPQTNLPICSNILETTGVQNVIKIGQVHKSDWRGNSNAYTEVSNCHALLAL